MSIQGFDHHIQREIFLQLRSHDVARYADLKVKNIESSQFMYHLKELIRMGLVEKVDKGRYRLTTKGLRLSQNFSSEKKDLTLAPLTYSIIFARSKAGRWLISKRGKQPYIHQLGALSGKVHLEETLQEAVKREWQTAIGESIPEFIYQGQVSVLIIEDDAVKTHVTGPVWFADNLDEWSKFDSALGTLEWLDWKDLPYNQFIPGWKEIIEAIEANQGPFLLDLRFTL